ncbi:hypothetical protein Vadar_025996 [Vaccinium darrowii]|uniref:Uncharacterized protein n=1 Tax=Vaccinium darrowii TaxID=229202 RepID=A0ACB7YI82_9ERIC|nr:hypothetical protein Vadar_025996 [Vaccinium darrowii]
MPNKLWERVKLPRNYEKALEIIDKHLMYWPKYLVHKTKQRLTKMTQMRIRMRKLALKTREKIMTTPRKEKKRDARTEEKAEKAAVLDKSIEKELLERLKKGVYGDIYNYPVEAYNKVLDMEAASEDQIEEEIEYVEGYEELEEEDDIEDFGGLAIRKSHIDVDDGVDDEDEEAVTVDRKRVKRHSKHEKDESDAKLKKKKKKKKKARVLVEVEREDTDERQFYRLDFSRNGLVDRLFFPRLVTKGFRHFVAWTTNPTSYGVFSTALAMSVFYAGRVAGINFLNDVEKRSALGPGFISDRGCLTGDPGGHHFHFPNGGGSENPLANSGIFTCSSASTIVFRRHDDHNPSHCKADALRVRGTRSSIRPEFYEARLGPVISSLAPQEGMEGSLRYKRTYGSQDVAIKVLAAEFLNADVRREFAREVYILRVNELAKWNICSESSIIGYVLTAEWLAGAVPPLKTLLEGVDMTNKQLLEVFKKSGVEKYDPTNEQFEPNRHNAAFHFPDASKAVVSKPGYVLHDRVLRPAEVSVTVDVDNETNQGSES